MGAMAHYTLVAVTVLVLLTGYYADARLMRKRRSTRIQRSDGKEDSQRSERFFQQKLDHSKPTDKRIWEQRFFSDATYYKLGGPAVIAVGGEFPQRHEQMTHRLIMDIAKGLDGKAFLLEHRYYGASHPTSNLSVPNLQWLTATQALGDLAYFIEHLRKQGEIAASSKVVVYGCSYAGNLAAWARMKYPHLVHAAVAASAPLRAKAEFPEFLQEVTRVLRHYGGEKCISTVREAFVRVDKLVETSEGLEKLKRYFNVCEPFTGSMEDREYLVISLTGPLQSLVDSHDKYKSYSQADFSSLEKMCLLMTSGFQGTDPDHIVQKLAAAIKTLEKSEDCFNASYASELDTHRDEVWEQHASDDDPDADSRQWLYQTCTEFGYFETMTVDSFGIQRYPLNMSEQLCGDIFGQEFDGNTIRSGVAHTNLQFGGDLPDLNRVVFVGAEMDPWRTLGVNRSLHDLAPEVVIRDGHHCQEISEVTDRSNNFKAVREAIIQHLRNFLEEEAIYKLKSI